MFNVYVNESESTSVVVNVPTTKPISVFSSTDVLLNVISVGGSFILFT